MSRVLLRRGAWHQLRLRWVWISWGDGHQLVAWLQIGGHKPLAHLPRWRRRLFHLPAIRVRLLPFPPTWRDGRDVIRPGVGWKQGMRDVLDDRTRLYLLCKDVIQLLPPERREEFWELLDQPYGAGVGPES